MSMLILSGALSILWVLATEEFAPFNFFVGAVIGYAVLHVSGARPTLAALRPSRVLRLLGLVAYFFRELILANLTMAYYTLAPLDRIKPAIVRVPLEPMSQRELMVLANLITLTPGTLSVETTPDLRSLYIHSMYVDDVEAFRQSIKTGFERRVLEAMR